MRTRRIRKKGGEIFYRIGSEVELYEPRLSRIPAPQQTMQLGNVAAMLAAKSFVSRRGLGRMRHLQIRDLRIQKEVHEGRIQVKEIPGNLKPADLMTKLLGISDIKERLIGMSFRMEEE